MDLKYEPECSIIVGSDPPADSVASVATIELTRCRNPFQTIKIFMILLILLLTDRVEIQQHAPLSNEPEKLRDRGGHPALQCSE